MDGTALGVACARDESGVFQNLNVLRDRLFGDRERFREFVDGGGPAAEPGDDAAADRVGQGSECQVELVVVRVVVHGRASIFSNLQVYQPSG